MTTTNEIALPRTPRKMTPQELRRKIAAFFGQDRRRRWWLAPEVATRIGMPLQPVSTCMNQLTRMGLLDRERIFMGKEAVVTYRRAGETKDDLARSGE